MEARATHQERADAQSMRKCNNFPLVVRASWTTSDLIYRLPYPWSPSEEFYSKPARSDKMFTQLLIKCSPISRSFSRITRRGTTTRERCDQKPRALLSSLDIACDKLKITTTLSAFATMITIICYKYLFNATRRTTSDLSCA